MSNAPTLIDLPPPPSDPVTPSDIPGTPNSTTTSMSELSTVAIKDGHRGHLHHHHHHPQPLDAERADRISRLAGLERVSTTRTPSGLANAATSSGSYSGPGQQNPNNPASGAGFFDTTNPQLLYHRERSTVGSASATGSVGGRTTWASGSDVYDPDKMSEDQDAEVETSSVGGMSDEAGSLVAFGEGARTPARQLSGLQSPAVGGGPKVAMNTQGTSASAMLSASAVPSYLRDREREREQTVLMQMTPAADPQAQDARMIDGMTYDSGVVDTANRTPLPAYASGATDTAERNMRERAEGGDGVADGRMGFPDEGANGGRGMGKLNFAGKR
ncbi:hypothetical protein W97_04459 [Coniosporium apollinis CBS 100218]|uniref:Uncharacterized protein n=1 Tax=Coniosporium apollinis (strain CBS 100218) TaxID=1168221 RepID=R7YTG4_CONA1|nr:uncharacterized protein W97_04459 [Coniosporium apollinis CBS 100218]EON65222.1 hypothetical protein W97_04459 [Coniosporium apollinis CBS 100218]